MIQVESNLDQGAQGCPRGCVQGVPRRSLDSLWVQGSYQGLKVMIGGSNIMRDIKRSFGGPGKSLGAYVVPMRSREGPENC